MTRTTPIQIDAAGENNAGNGPPSLEPMPRPPPRLLPTIPELPSSIQSDNSQRRGGRPFHIEVRLNAKFREFPGLIRRLLQRDYEDALMKAFEAQMAHVEKGTTHKALDSYCVVETTFPFPAETGIEHKLVQSNISCRAVANQLAMNLFLKRNPKMVFATREEIATVKWKEVGESLDLCNPAYLADMVVDSDEIAFGFDAIGCLAFHTITENTPGMAGKSELVFVMREPTPMVSPFKTPPL
jgi:hypothetical protein